MLCSPIRLPLFLVALAALTSCASGSDRALAPRPAQPGVADKVRRLAAILDYVAADYPGAVDHGQVVSQDELDEQVSFVSDAAELAKSLPPPPPDLDLSGRLDALASDLSGVAEAEKVSAAARSLGHDLMDAYHVVVAPAAPPSFDRGQTLFRENCVRCHGETGAGDGVRTRQDPPLKVPPRSFQDPKVMAEMSPVRAYNALTDGIAQTEMPKWDLLSPSDRWSLAFYIFTLRHGEEPAGRGRELVSGLKPAPPSSATELSRKTDADLAARLGDAGLQGDDVEAALAYLRRVAPYETRGAKLTRARELLASALGAYRSGDHASARQQAAAAYLDSFEPHEAALRAQDAELVHTIEAAFLEVRQGIAQGETADVIEQRILHLGTLLDRAEDALDTQGGASVAFVSSLVILVREGLEAALLILLLYGVAKKAGSDERDMRAVHSGWLSALLLGLATWFLAGSLIEAVGGAGREIIEGTVALFAAAVLLGVSHYVLARLDAKRRVAALKERLQKAASSTSRRWLLLFGLGFVAVYREAFETVLFLRAVMLDANSSGLAVAGGALTGALILAALVFAMTRLGKRLKPAPILTGLGTLLCVLSVILAGKGIRALQEAGVISIAPLGKLRIDWLGVYPTSQTMLAQFAVAAAFAVIAVVALMRTRPAPAKAPLPGARASERSG